jgi:hypothetical protein
LLRCVNETEQMAAGMTIIWFSHILFPTSLIAILSIPSNCNSHFTLSKHNLWANHSLIVPELRRPVKQICHTTTSPACRAYNNSGSSLTTSITYHVHNIQSYQGASQVDFHD